MLPSSNSTVLSPASFCPLLCLLWLRASFSHRYQMAANNSWGYIFSFMLRGRAHLPQPSNKSPKLSSRSGCVTCPFLSFDKALRYCRYAEASLVAEPAKNPLAVQGIQVPSLGWEVPWRRKGQPTPLFLPGKSHGQRSLVGYSAWGHRESERTQ